MSATLSLFQEERLKCVDVAIPLPVGDPFTYTVPNHLLPSIKIGCRVRVPFKNRTITGFLVSEASEKQVDRAKNIIEVSDSEPFLTDHHLRLAKWISEYYFSSWGEAISNMVPKFYKRKKSKALSADTTALEPEKTKKEKFQLNEEQATAFRRIKHAIDQNQFSELFLFGVTGGGKSELYIRAIKEVLARGESAICLVPEIALTEQIKLFFHHHFHDQLEILHSKLTDSARREAWQRVRTGKKRVILGARSAIFAPAAALGLIIMDEEQEGSYKQDRTPRYHAREVARWRAKDLKIPFLMGTATPTLESMHRTTSGEVKLLTLTKRVDKRPMPEVKIIDLKQAREITKKSVIISSPLREEIGRSLEARGGILILLNRRGHSTHIRCDACQFCCYCSHCAVALTFHQNEQELICHYCNYHVPIPSTCPKCKQPLFKFLGVGTEKVESEIARLFPAARVARLDSDTARKRGVHEKILSDFRAQKIDILVGTQMIAKGFDFHHVTLVGIVNADTGLLLPDFRSSERTFQLLTQMAGRTGRGREPGKVFVQTQSPLHYSIQHAAKHEYPGFFSEELERRREFQYPPFTRLINVACRGKNEQAVEEQSVSLGKLLKTPSEQDRDDIEVLGPAPLPLYRLRGHYRWHVMLRGPDTDALRTRLRQAIGSLKRKTGVFVAIDVDPISIL